MFSLRRQPKVEVSRVNVGCGPHHQLAGWWNVDIRHFPGVDEVADATKEWPYQNLQYVYAEHFLEHLTLEGAIQFLTNAGRSLRAGGTLRLSTPNLEWVMRTHYRTSGDTLQKIEDTLKTNRAFHGWGHQFLYSAELLRYLLGELQFSDLDFPAYGESSNPDLRNLERHGGYSVFEGQPSVIIVEACRGDAPPAPSEELMSRLDEQYLRYVRSGH